MEKKFYTALDVFKINAQKNVSAANTNNSNYYQNNSSK